jgi:hypothetical protein
MPPEEIHLWVKTNLQRQWYLNVGWNDKEVWVFKENEEDNYIYARLNN